MVDPIGQRDPRRQRPWLPPEISIAGYRVVLGVFAVVATWVDPKIGGKFHLDSLSLYSLGGYLVYAIGVWVALLRGWISRETEAHITTVADVLFGLLIAAVTHAASSPYTVFLAFGVLAAGARGDYVRCLAVTAASVLGFFLLEWAELGLDFYIMRPVYLGVMGWMLAALGRSYSAYFTEAARDVTTLEERNRIARTLHDGYLQTVAGATLQIEAARQALREGSAREAGDLLEELRDGLDREHDELRAYVRTLAAAPERNRQPLRNGPGPRLRIDAVIATTIPTYEWIGSIVREALTNVRRHANASNAEVRLRATEREISVVVTDDGVGFSEDAPLPWSIESRVIEAGGAIELDRNGLPGARLLITLPHKKTTL